MTDSLLSFRPGDHVTYVDEAGHAHAAVVEQWHEPHDGGTCDIGYCDGDSIRHALSVCRKGSPGFTETRYWQPDGEPVPGTLRRDLRPAHIPARLYAAPPPVRRCTCPPFGGTLGTSFGDILQVSMGADNAAVQPCLVCGDLGGC